MKSLRRFFLRLSSWATRERDEQRLWEEIEEHLALQTAENIRAGMSLQEARRQASLKCGAVEAVKERYREQRGLPFMETLIQDARHALRPLANGASVHNGNGLDPRFRYRSYNFDFHFSGCDFA